MVLNRSPEFKDVIVQIVCVVENQFESAWDAEDFNISCVFLPHHGEDPTTISTN